MARNHHAARVAAAAIDGDHIDRLKGVDGFDCTKQRGKSIGQRDGFIDKRNDDGELHRLGPTDVCRDRILRTTMGVNARAPRSTRLPASSGDRRPVSESMLPSACPRFTKTNVPGTMPIAVAATNVDTGIVVNAGARLTRKNGNNGTRRSDSR